MEIDSFKNVILAIGKDYVTAFNGIVQVFYGCPRGEGWKGNYPGNNPKGKPVRPST
jgi:hypothetical protein